MCGRVAQTLGVVDIAERNFSASSNNEASNTSTPTASVCHPSKANFNLSPGMDCDVMLVNENGDLEISRKKWGLISKNGTAKKPLYNEESEIIKLCFESLCFNARSETLYSKPTFSKLVLGGRTCIIAVDGYFEWKSHPIPKMNKTKQPYFVYRKRQLGQESAKEDQRKGPLLIAGVWTKVKTGRTDAPELGSFSMLTTDASDQIKWLHHRMPVCIWDINLAKEWLTQPSETLKKKIDDAARSESNGFCWHKVTPAMSKLSFRSEEAIMEVKAKTQSIKSFFGPGRLSAKQTCASFNANTNDKNIKEAPCVKPLLTVSGATPKYFKPAPIREHGTRRLQSPSTSYLSPSPRKKVKLNGSRGFSSSNKQISIDSFFGKKKQGK
eukprot:CAMPEP_0116142130 /NCGR_PEP_ID=MMETSP0329-20121206/14743_1 /TAXON_ID=697910 /ORGANISM="Pseudo-nitzschia arenysensis, Strain B593" /LENGTH=381 /DNA_ID=CAMNT_0003637343 /DNA_START=124 /DNA_END=1269 /DNA_ORIENTATION=-